MNIITMAILAAMPAKSVRLLEMPDPASTYRIDVSSKISLTRGKQRLIKISVRNLSVKQVAFSTYFFGLTFRFKTRHGKTNLYDSGADQAPVEDNSDWVVLPPNSNFEWNIPLSRVYNFQEKSILYISIIQRRDRKVPGYIRDQSIPVYFLPDTWSQIPN